jgi:hypothetical protein
VHQFILCRFDLNRQPRKALNTDGKPDRGNITTLAVLTTAFHFTAPKDPPAIDHFIASRKKTLEAALNLVAGFVAFVHPQKMR